MVARVRFTLECQDARSSHRLQHPHATISSAWKSAIAFAAAKVPGHKPLVILRFVVNGQQSQWDSMQAHSARPWKVALSQQGGGVAKFQL